MEGGKLPLGHFKRINSFWMESINAHTNCVEIILSVYTMETINMGCKLWAIYSQLSVKMNTYNSIINLRQSILCVLEIFIIFNTFITARSLINSCYCFRSIFHYKHHWNRIEEQQKKLLKADCYVSNQEEYSLPEEKRLPNNVTIYHRCEMKFNKKKCGKSNTW